MISRPCEGHTRGCDITHHTKSRPKSVISQVCAICDDAAWSHCSGDLAVSLHDLPSSSDKIDLSTLLHGQNSRKAAAPQP